jgi:hypothetical protein
VKGVSAKTQGYASLPVCVEVKTGDHHACVLVDASVDLCQAHLDYIALAETIPGIVFTRNSAYPIVQVS